jgi:DNA-binding MarR family transcriptional regulator
MHVVFFGLKRAYHGALRVTRRALARLGLTAARFDLLYILQRSGQALHQRELRRALGVAGSTVSRMLTSLEELGLLMRERSPADGRQRTVELTKAGRRCVLRAARLLIHTGGVQLAVDSALCPDQWHEPFECSSARLTFDHRLRDMRHAYRDVATLHYPSIWAASEEFDDPGP